MAGQIKPAARDVHTLSHGTCKYGTLHEKRDFTGVTKSRILTRRDFLELFEEAQNNHKDPFRKAVGESKLEKEDVRTEQRSERREDATGLLRRWRKGPRA